VGRWDFATETAIIRKNGKPTYMWDCVGNVEKEVYMEVIKWDGVSDADLILKALLFFIDEEDEEKALKTSYGDFGKYLQKMYRGSGAGNGDISVESFKGNPRIFLKKKGIAYQLTWNKAAKLIHKHLHEEVRR